MAIVTLLPACFGGFLTLGCAFDTVGWAAGGAGLDGPADDGATG